MLQAVIGHIQQSVGLIEAQHRALILAPQIGPTSSFDVPVRRDVG